MENVACHTLLQSDNIDRAWIFGRFELQFHELQHTFDLVPLHTLTLHTMDIPLQCVLCFGICATVSVVNGQLLWCKGISMRKNNVICNWLLRFYSLSHTHSLSLSASLSQLIINLNDFRFDDA